MLVHVLQIDPVHDGAAQPGGEPPFVQLVHDPSVEEHAPQFVEDEEQQIELLPHLPLVQAVLPEQDCPADHVP